MHGEDHSASRENEADEESVANRETGLEFVGCADVIYGEVVIAVVNEDQLLVCLSDFVQLHNETTIVFNILNNGKIISSFNLRQRQMLPR